ncbi:hypothetical protein AVEN_147074-1 [Araneus ventricosus]|uniref:Uncharacterized protein n=1 Tax=Araneus ventricosus TaxID=182803 RepID=A0A4Y2E3B0_ARAVE|nr:hypothetical protein AVEN_147074-1 [Araneus ventricosus]
MQDDAMISTVLEMSRRLLTEKAFEYWPMNMADEYDDSDDACSSIEHGRAAFDEKIQEEADGTIEILKEKRCY